MAYTNYRSSRGSHIVSYSSEDSDSDDGGYSYSGKSTTSLVEEFARGFGKLHVGKEGRRYGYFRCPTCSKKWESGNAWCEYKGIKNGVKVYKSTSEQSCKQCKVMTPPYETKELDAPDPDEVRHVDQRKSHRSDLCSKCLAGQYCKSKISMF